MLESITTQLSALTLLIQNHPIEAVGIFMLLHFACSTFAVPGGCTMLNISAGALFGFWFGSLIVYVVTLLSASFGYFLARTMAKRFEWARIKTFLASDSKSYGVLVLLRLSPFVPFTIVNLTCGLSRVPFNLYLTSTFAGIFFDVVLLNGIGSSLLTTSSWQQKLLLVSGFVFLYFAMDFARRKIRVAA
jgi:uncharacterized membrane protein YdjX (TVP38/TMEM64 family)